MGDFLRIILDSIQFLWPLERVRQWERGGYYVCGRWWKEVGPGIYPVVPWFTSIMAISVVPSIVETPRQDITLSDGKVLYFSATATVQVTDLNLAINTIDNFTATTQELIASVLAEKIAQVDAERLAPSKRGRLLTDLNRWVADEAELFGVDVSKLRFTNFVVNAKTFRLLQNMTPTGW